MGFKLSKKLDLLSDRIYLSNFFIQGSGLGVTSETGLSFQIAVIKVNLWFNDKWAQLLFHTGLALFALIN